MLRGDERMELWGVPQAERVVSIVAAIVLTGTPVENGLVSIDAGVFEQLAEAVYAELEERP
jgi:hypothetical protein